MVRDKYLVSPFSLNFLKTFCVFWKYDSAYTKKGTPGGYWVPNQLFKGITFAMWTELLQTLKGITPSAELHAKRTDGVLKPVSEGDFEIYKEIDIHSERCVFFQLTSVLRGKDSAGDTIVAQNIIGDNLLGGTAAAWDSCVLPALAEDQEPSDVWALLAIFGITNDGANNIYQVRGAPVAPTTNLYWSLLKTGFNSTVAPTTEHVGTSSCSFMRQIPNLFRNSVYSLKNGVNDPLTDSFIVGNWLGALFGQTHHYIEAPFSAASLIWNDLVEIIYQEMFNKPIV
jgi:hypothetical protein